MPSFPHGIVHTYASAYALHKHIRKRRTHTLGGQRGKGERGSGRGMPSLTVLHIRMQVRTHCTSIYVRAPHIRGAMGKGGSGEGHALPHSITYMYASAYALHKHIRMRPTH